MFILSEYFLALNIKYSASEWNKQHHLKLENVIKNILNKCLSYWMDWNCCRWVQLRNCMSQTVNYPFLIKRYLLIHLVKIYEHFWNEAECPNRMIITLIYLTLSWTIWVQSTHTHTHSLGIYICFDTMFLPMHNSHKRSLPLEFFGNISVLLFPTLPIEENFSTTSEHYHLEDACCKQHCTPPTSVLRTCIIILYLDVLYMNV
jgi:hypothetical protein